MSRIRQAYEALFAARLRQLGARRPEQGVILLLDRASQSAQAEGLSPAQALLRVHRRLAIQTEPFLSRSAARCGAVPALAGADFANALLDDVADVRFEEFSNLPSAHFTLDRIWNLSRRVAALVAMIAPRMKHR